MSGHREEKVFKVTDHRWSGITSMVICVLTLVKYMLYHKHTWLCM